MIIFQFTASYEADHRLTKALMIFWTFNSQPHTRLTVCIGCRYGFCYLSIHSLIRGWPLAFPISASCRSLSIHSLIRGWPTMASTISFKNFLSIHSLIRGWPLIIRERNFMKIFQFTASYEADLCSCSSCFWVGNFQFTASYEADPVREYIKTGSFDLSIHSLIRGWPWA